MSLALQDPTVVVVATTAVDVEEDLLVVEDVEEALLVVEDVLDVVDVNDDDFVVLVEYLGVGVVVDEGTLLRALTAAAAEEVEVDTGGVVDLAVAVVVVG